MTDNIIARRYAKALFSLGLEKGGDELAAYGKDLAALAEILKGSPEALKVFRNPIFGAQDKKVVIGKMMDKLAVGQMVRNFCLLLADKDRLGYLPQIQVVFAELLDAHQGVLRGSLVTAVEVPDARKEAIKQQLESQAKAKLVLGYEIDPGILGGVVLKVGDKVLDASLRAQLSMLKEQIIRGE
ncbi:ATP synthase subunit delta [Desulfovibrio sp. X2]|uniref:ATP synthase F1 subunit delta n=1 Tax=Desulfovibrio sp. X2 TaxID=941449 RepID=UPI000358E0CF|nr:ATP synthase F1 subunit delta [Desulfovibrio sp. X2]EPR43846.1 ATP synthase subunit delta [Desulfovibrio sp. X2]